MRKNLQSNSLRIIHFDATYKNIPHIHNKMRLLVISGFDDLYVKQKFVTLF